tara:strand:- start:11 stop:370 length:360 start_codon:yes stop_codon:yes gene_type:complete
MAGNFNQNIIAEFDQSGTDVDTANGDNFTINRACSVYDAYVVARGATAGNTQLFHTDDTASNAITDNIGANSDQDLSRAGTIDDTKNAFTAGQILCIKKSTQVQTSTFVLFDATGVTLS